jgi:hypothetical protein
MRGGIAAGDILPCLRNGEIDFYEGGARLFRFGVNMVVTHRLHVDGHGKGDRTLGQAEQTRRYSTGFEIRHVRTAPVT